MISQRGIAATLTVGAVLVFCLTLHATNAAPAGRKRPPVGSPRDNNPESSTAVPEWTTRVPFAEKAENKTGVPTGPGMNVRPPRLRRCGVTPSTDHKSTVATTVTSTQDSGEDWSGDGAEDYDEESIKEWLRATPVTFPAGINPLDCCLSTDFSDWSTGEPLIPFCMFTANHTCGESSLFTKTVSGKTVCGKQWEPWVREHDKEANGGRGCVKIPANW